MKNEIIEELLNISNNGKFIDKNLIKKFILDSISNCDQITQTNFTDIWFARTNIKDAVCSSDPDKGLITIDYGKCLDEGFLYGKDYGSNRFISNLRILFIIFHEVEHLKEVSKMTKNDLESTILRLSSSLAMENKIEKDLAFFRPFLTENMYYTIQNKMFDRLYAKLYSLDPTEKIANLGSYKYILDGLNNYPIDEENEFVKNVMKSESIKEYCTGYTNDENYSPTVSYVNKLNSNNSLYKERNLRRELIKFKNAIYSIDLLTSEEKMRLGLPISIKDRKILIKSLKSE